MKCITLCDENITYEKFEFPHGYYIVPLNDDGTIHMCKTLRSESEQISVDSDEVHVVHDLYLSFENELEDIRFTDYPCVLQVGDKDFVEKATRLLKILFLINHVCPDPFLDSIPNIFPVGFGYPELIEIIELLYHDLGDSSSSHDARLIANKFELSLAINEKPPVINDESNINSEEFWNLLKKYSEFSSTSSEIIDSQEDLNEQQSENFDEDEKYSISSIREYVRKVEYEAKEFLRKRITEIEIKKYFDFAYVSARKYQKENSDIFDRSHDDVIEFLTFSGTVGILFGNVDRKNSQELNEEFKKASHLQFHIPRIHKSYFNIIHPFRNEHSHVTDTITNNSVKLDFRKLSHYCCTLIIDYFESMKKA